MSDIKVDKKDDHDVKYMPNILINLIIGNKEWMKTLM